MASISNSLNHNFDMRQLTVGIVVRETPRELEEEMAPRINEANTTELANINIDDLEAMIRSPEFQIHVFFYNVRVFFNEIGEFFRNLGKNQ